MKLGNLLSVAAATGIATALLFTVSSAVVSPAGAMGGDAPKPKIDCRKRKNKKKPECKKKKQSSLTDDELYQAGYWLARAGKYEEALAQFRQARNQNDPRILNYIGFSMRKLGQVDEAMVAYNRVLTVDPNYTLARAYLAEAFLTQGKVDLAAGQLAEIGRRCGTTCEEYVVLARQIDSYRTSGTFEAQGVISGTAGRNGTKG